MDVTTDISKTMKALNGLHALADKAVKKATLTVAQETTRTMKKQIVGGHKLGTTRAEGKNIQAGKPSNVTGNLRRSIRYSVTGFNGRYTAVVGAYQVYARALEFGNPRWASGARYPFVSPTAKIMSDGNKARKIYMTALEEALRKV